MQPLCKRKGSTAKLRKLGHHSAAIHELETLGKAFVGERSDR